MIVRRREDNNITPVVIPVARVIEKSRGVAPIVEYSKPRVPTIPELVIINNRLYNSMGNRAQLLPVEYISSTPASIPSLITNFICFNFGTSRSETIPDTKLARVRLVRNVTIFGRRGTTSELDEIMQAIDSAGYMFDSIPDKELPMVTYKIMDRVDYGVAHGNSMVLGLGDHSWLS